jgi:hypothetical protein
MRDKQKAASEPRARRCSDCGVDISDRAPGAIRCLKHAKEQERAVDRKAAMKSYWKKAQRFDCYRCGRNKSLTIGSACPSCAAEISAEVSSSVAAAPSASIYPWREARCASCGLPFIKKSANAARCPACKPQRDVDRLREYRLSKGGKPSRRIPCASCGLPFTPRTEGGPDCAVCVYDRSVAAGKKSGVAREAYVLREQRAAASVVKPPVGKCIVCGEASMTPKTWYCSKEHERKGYQLLVASQKDRIDVASYMEFEGPDEVFDTTIGHKGRTRKLRPNRRRRSWRW